MPDFNISQCQSIAKMLASQNTILRLDKAITKEMSGRAEKWHATENAGHVVMETTGRGSAIGDSSSAFKQQNQVQEGFVSELQPSPPIGPPSEDRQYIDGLLDIVDRAIVTEYGTEDTEELTLGEIFEALKAVETKLISGTKRKNARCSSDIEYKRAKFTDSEPFQGTELPRLNSRQENDNTNMSHSAQQQSKTLLSKDDTARPELGDELLLSKSEERMLLGDLDKDAHRMMTLASPQCYL